MRSPIILLGFAFFAVIAISLCVRDGSGAPYLMTSGHSGEIDGFVQDTSAAYFNAWSMTQLGLRWAYVQED